MIYIIDLLAQVGNLVHLLSFVANNEERENVMKHVGSDLLGSIAPSLVGGAMRFDDETIEAQIHGLLTEGSYKLAFASNVTRVANDGEFGNATSQFYGNLPRWVVAIEFVVVTGKTSMNGAYALDACLVEALHSTNPQF